LPENRQPRFALIPTLLAVCAVLTTGCGGTTFYRPGQAWRVRPEAPTQVNDEDIRAAFEARPQLPARSRVAYFAFDQARTEELGATLRELPGVEGVHEIAPLWVTGERRFDEASEEPQELDLRQLRLLAARAHCELLVVVDHGYRVREEVNGWFAFAPLVLPLLFTPYVDSHVDSYLDAYVIDVRNGYLYGHLASHEEDVAREQTIYSDVAARLADEQWAALLGRARRAMVQILAGDAETSGDGERPAVAVAQ
jgi:hypothetical protein